MSLNQPGPASPLYQGVRRVPRSGDSPLEIAEMLARELDTRASDLRKYDMYYRGNQPLAFAQQKFREAFGGMFATWSDNFCPLIVDSLAERIRVEGFRMTDDPQADKDAHEIWQRNGMDAGSNSAHTEAFISERSHVIVWGDSDGRPVLSPEHPAEVTVAFDPGNRRRRVAALKRYRDDWGTEHRTLYLPDAVYRWRQSEGNEPTELETLPNPLGVVPVVPLLNAPRLSGDPSSELARIIPIQDAINKTMVDALVASEYAAFPQRWVTGLEIIEDENGQAVEPYKVDIAKLLQAEDPGAKFGQFQAADLSNYVRLVEGLVQHLASVSRVPFHYFLINGGQAPSGESIKSAEAGLVSKARDRMRHFGESWEEVMRLAFKVQGDSRSEAFDAETIWADPEYRTEGEHVDALLKLQTLGVPSQQLWQDAGYSPSQIERFEAMRAQDLLRRSLEVQALQPAPQEPAPREAEAE